MTAAHGLLAGRVRSENTVTKQSRRITIVDPGAPREADLRADPLDDPNFMPEDPCMVAVQ